MAATAIVIEMASVSGAHRWPLQQATATNVEALLDAGSYEQAESVARARLAAVPPQPVDRSDEGAAIDLLFEALLFNGKGGTAEARALAERSVALAGSNPAASTARPLINLANVYIETGEYSRAIPLLEEAAAQVANRLPVDTLQLAEALDALGAALSAQGQLADAETTLERSLALKETLEKPAEVVIVPTLLSLGRTQQRRAEYARARATLERALSLQPSSPRPFYVRTLNLVALQSLLEGNPDAGRTAASEALQVAERTLRPDHPLVAQSLRYLGGAALDFGDLLEAQQLLERALVIARKSLGPSHPEMWLYPNDLAGPTRLLGDYPAARRLLQESLSIAEGKFGTWHDSVATSIHNLALVDASLGDYAKARLEQAQAARIWERVFGRDHPFVAVALIELASVYREQGSPAEAVPLLERALAIRLTRLGSDHPDVARTEADLAATLLLTGAKERAEHLAERAVRSSAANRNPNAADVATILTVYADTLFQRGDAVQARGFYERAVSMRTSIFGTGHPMVAESELGLAAALVQLGEPVSALHTAARAESVSRAHLRAMLVSLPERQALTYAATRPQGLSLLVSLVSTTDDGASIALNEIVRSRALILDEMAARHAAALATGDKDAMALYEAFGLSQRRLTNLVVRGPGQLTPPQYADALARARLDRERAEESLAAQNAQFRIQRQRSSVSLEEVQAALPSDSALVSFFRYAKQSPPGTAKLKAGATRLAATRPSYVAFVLRPDRPPVAIPIGSAAGIDALVSRWRQDIFDDARSNRAEGAPRQESRTSGRALRRMVWDPVTPALGNAARVFLVPDGSLALVPFAALPTGAQRYLVETGPTLQYLSAERDVAEFSAKISASGTGLLALGGPAFNARAATASPGRSTDTRSATIACEGFEAMSFSPLSGTLGEVEDVANSWNSQAKTHASILVGSQATESAFKSAAAGRSVLHLATHGFFLQDSCSPTIAGSRSVGGLVKRSQPATRAENPLLLSGLALAGANQRRVAKTTEDDGILTAEEVSSLNLSGVQWAVLSACNTGVGQITANEGVFGLRRAFQIAGARTVVMSLWPVEDRATRAWMKALYEARFKRDMATDDAVRAASLEVLRARRARGQTTDPFYWSSFVSVGDWR